MPETCAEQLVLMYGGTFDPVHHGHLRCAMELLQLPAIARIHMIPCKQPVHRGQPGATAAQRLQMLRLAVAGEPNLLVDDRELQRDSPSWTIDTLISLRQEYGDRKPLGLVLGWDAFVQLPGWSRWQQLLDYAHLLVLDRPGAVIEPESQLAGWLQQHLATSLHHMQQQPAGKIVRLALPPLDIASTRIRQLLAAGQSARYLLPDSVLQYLQQEGIYVPQTLEPACSPTC